MNSIMSYLGSYEVGQINKLGHTELLGTLGHDVLLIEVGRDLTTCENLL